VYDDEDKSPFTTLLPATPETHKEKRLAKQASKETEGEPETKNAESRSHSHENQAISKRQEESPPPCMTKGAAIAPRIRNVGQIPVNAIRSSDFVRAENAELNAMRESG
jgi:hypothetical protein